MEKNIPELGKFHKDEKDLYIRVSENSLPAREMVALMNERLGDYMRDDIVDRAVAVINPGDSGKFECTRVKFTDIQYQCPKALPRVKLTSPCDLKGDYYPYQDKIVLKVNRGGHDGIANGGSYGWYYRLYTDGNVSVGRANDESWQQSGNHRLRQHSDEYDAVVTVSGGSWLVVKHDYRGQIYSHPDSYDIYGQPPENFLRFQKETV